MEPTKPKFDTSTVAAPQSEISRLLDELNIVSMDLQDNTASLIGTLRPIIRNEPSAEDNAAKGYDASTEMGQFLCTVITRLRAMNAAVNDTRSKVEL